MIYSVTNLGPVLHDGKHYGEGDTLPSLNDKEAAQLLELGVIVEAPSKTKPKDA